MALAEQEIPFRPPLPRSSREIWQATYQLSRRDFLEAVEYVVPFLKHPVEGLHWEFEGFRRHRLYLLQSGDAERGLPPVSVEFGFRVTVDNIRVTVYVNTSSNFELQLFRRLTTELDEVEYVADARLTPCTYIGLQPPIYSPDWY